MIGDLSSNSFEGYLFVTRWNATIDEEKQKKLLEITDVTSRIDSLEALKKYWCIKPKDPLPEDYLRFIGLQKEPNFIYWRK